MKFNQEASVAEKIFMSFLFFMASPLLAGIFCGSIEAFLGLKIDDGFRWFALFVSLIALLKYWILIYFPISEEYNDDFLP